MKTTTGLERHFEVNMTPELAKEYLLMNTNNRTLNKAIMEKYCSDLREGKWFPYVSTPLLVSENRHLLKLN